MIIGVTVLLAAVVLVLLAIVMALILGWANQAFHVAVDPKVEAIIEALPGANCGGCGYVGCAEYAEAVAKGDAEVSLCAPGGAGCALKLAAIMGVEVDASAPYRPVIHCAAKLEDRLLRSDYHGEQTCAAANLVAGVQGCTYGCLGLGDCVRACNYDSIHIVDGLAVVDYDKCIGCKACARACPRNIITMVPFKCEQMFVVACSNKDSGKAVSAVCTVGCIACGACAKANPDLIKMVNNLPSVDYDVFGQDTDVAAIQHKCKRAGLVMVGKPSAKDLAAVADEEVPDQIEADFKTTADDAEWRG